MRGKVNRVLYDEELNKMGLRAGGYRARQWAFEFFWARGYRATNMEEGNGFRLFRPKFAMHYIITDNKNKK